MNKNTDQIEGFKRLISFLEQNPEFPYVSVTLGSSFDTKEEFQKAASMLGGASKHYVDEIFYLSKAFSPNVDLQLYIVRDLVCRRISKGFTTLPPEPAKPERQVETFDWEYDEPILKSIPSSPSLQTSNESKGSNER